MLITGAGRTDAGVHALGQVAHFDSEALRDPRNWLLGINSNLPADIAVVWVRETDESFNARFSARARTYRYGILNRAVRPALHATRLSWFRRPLDAARMHAAAQALVGEHDFSAYRAQACQARHPVREIESIAVTRAGDEVWIEVTANAFLHHMVRNIVGVLMAIGSGERPASWAGEVLATRRRALGGVTAPPQGLYLVAVRYPQRFGLPDFATGGET